MTDKPLSETLSRHSSLWMEDGNVVLVVDNIGFKVHRSILAKHSEVFRDMFFVPQPPSDATSSKEIVEGCPVVRIPDEDPEALAFVLGVLYDGGVHFYNPAIWFGFKTVITAFVCAAKFQFENILEEALCRLKWDFPSDTEDLRHVTSCIVSEPHHRGCHDNHFSQADAITMVNVAVKLELNDLLLPALYICSQLPVKVLFEAVSDGPRFELHTFSMENLKLCMLFRSDLQEASIKTFEPLFSGSVGWRCHAVQNRGESCSSIYSDILRAAYKTEGLKGRTNALWSIADYLEDFGDGSERLCDRCFGALCKKSEEVQAEVWDKLHEKYIRNQILRI